MLLKKPTSLLTPGDKTLGQVIVALIARVCLTLCREIKPGAFICSLV